MHTFVQFLKEHIFLIFTMSACNKCNKNPAKICQGCSSVNYDWCTHKHLCVGMEVKHQLKLINKNTTTKSCTVCSKSNRSTKLRKCSTCPDVLYCSYECQRLDWSQHKKVCHSLIVQDNVTPKLKKPLNVYQKKIRKFTVQSWKCCIAGDREGESEAYKQIGNGYHRLGLIE